MSKESRRERRGRSRARRADPERSISGGNLNLVVATSPTTAEGGRFLAHDLELVRASLLYADSVELLSPAALMVGGVAAVHHAGPEALMKVLGSLDDEALARFGDRDPQELRETVRAYQALASLPRAERRKRLGSRRSAELQRLFADFRSTMAAPGGPREMMGEVLEQAQVPELDAALEAGVLTLSTDFMTLDADTDTQIEEYTARLKALLAQPSTHLLLDERMSGIAQSLIDDGQVTPSAATMTRVVRSRVGTGLVAQLPAFPGASIEAILETREELSAPLARYRGGVNRLSKTVESDPLSAGVSAEVEDMWRDEVVPAVNDLRADLSATRLGHDAAVNLGRDSKSILAGGAFIFGVESFTDHSTLLAAGFSAASVTGKAVLDAYKDLAGQWRQAKRHDLFYLLALEEQL